MIKLLIVCGIPASGKTTLSTTLATRYGLVRISEDEIGHANVIRSMVEALQSGRGVVVDTVGNLSATRRNLLRAVRDIPCQKVCVVMRTPVVECLHRNSKREHPAQEQSIRRMAELFQAPTPSEGWDEIKEVK